jgi:two-component system cell cycle response regulator
MTEQMKILVVDDSSALRGIIRQELEMGQYEVIEAANGAEALELINTDSPPNLVTLDIDMPKMDGFETLQKLIRKFDTGTASSDQGGPP